LVDVRAWYPVVSGQIPVAELLSSDLKTIFVDLRCDRDSDLFTQVVVDAESSLRDCSTTSTSTATTGTSSSRPPTARNPTRSRPMAG
jgi:hypothetical protein